MEVPKRSRWRNESLSPESDFHAPAVEIVQQRVRFRIVVLESFRAVGRLRPSHLHIAVRAEIPHGQLGKEFVWARAGIGFLPQPVFQRAAVLFIDAGPNLGLDSMIAYIVGEF